MTLLRFMCAHEAITLLSKFPIRNKTHHGANGQSTTSVGSCFAICLPTHNYEDAIYQAATYLSGIVTMDVCLVAELPEPIRNRAWKKTQGRYSVGMLEEMSTKEYRLYEFEQWRMYTPELPPIEQGLKLIWSGNWERPVLARTSGD